MYKPNQDVYRFGNHFIVNQYGMRTSPFSIKKANGEFRIMIFGDSVLNGGSHTDHDALATTILQKRLGEEQQNVVVGNISAKSWGPGNWYAYASEYGFFEADLVVLVVSSHDHADNPTFQPLNENKHPTDGPASAFIEVFTRYLPRYLPQIGAGEAGTERGHFEAGSNDQEVRKGLKDLRGFLKLAKNNSIHVLVVQHLEKSELNKSTASYGSQRIKQTVESIGIPSISLEPYFHRSMQDGRNPYRDNIHPNQIGQQLIANAIHENMPANTLHRTDSKSQALGALQP